MSQELVRAVEATGASALVVRDRWHRLPEADRAEFLARRTAAGRWSYGGPEGWHRGRRWQPMRPLVVDEIAYQALGGITSRLLRLAVDACRRRAATVGELREVMCDPRTFHLLEPRQLLDHEALLRVARPDVLFEHGVPRFVELNIAIPLYGIPALDRMSEAYARLWPDRALTSPASVLRARSELIAAAAPRPAAGRPRLLVPTWRSPRGQAAKLGNRRALRAYLRPTVEAAERSGLDVVVEDLSRLRTDGGHRLYAGGRRVDLVLNWFVSARISHEAGGLAAIGAALDAGTVRVFFPEAMRLLSGKQVLAWLHEDLDALGPDDRALVSAYVPWTAWCGPQRSGAYRDRFVRDALRLRSRLVLKPSLGSSGQGVVFGCDVDACAWRTLVEERVRRETVILQRQVDADTVPMPFLDPSTGQGSAARLPFVMAPFVIGGRICGSLVRHFAPASTPPSKVINTHTGAVVNTVLVHRS